MPRNKNELVTTDFLFSTLVITYEHPVQCASARSVLDTSSSAVGMRMIKAYNVMASQPGFALYTHQFPWTYMIAVLWRISTRVAAFHHASDSTIIRLVKLAHQHAATLVRISLFPMLPQLFE